MSNNKYKVLIIEDEQNINNLLDTLMQANGYQTIIATSCGSGLMMYASHRPDIVILDLGLPDKDGIAFLTEIRKTDFTPVIVLSARSDEKDKVEALNLGANDYVTKPFGSEELVARVRSALRTALHQAHDSELPTGKFQTGDLLIDYEARRVFIGDEEIKLTQTEYNIVYLLSRHPGKMLTYSFIVKEVWGYNDMGSTKRLQVNMANIRKKFGVKPGKKNVECAVSIRERCERMNRHPKIKAIVFNDNAANVLSNAVNFRGVPYDIQYIGNLKRRYSETALLNSQLESEALKRHLQWGTEDAFWNCEFNYRSSVASVIHQRVKLQCNIPGVNQNPNERNPADRDRLRLIEHRRWNAYMRAEGYCYSGSRSKESRNDLAKIHPDLVPFDMLTEKEKEKDDV